MTYVDLLDFLMELWQRSSTKALHILSHKNHPHGVLIEKGAPRYQPHHILQVGLNSPTRP